MVPAGSGRFESGGRVGGPGSEGGSSEAWDGARPGRGARQPAARAVRVRDRGAAGSGGAVGGGAGGPSPGSGRSRIRGRGSRRRGRSESGIGAQPGQQARYRSPQRSATCISSISADVGERDRRIASPACRASCSMDDGARDRRGVRSMRPRLRASPRWSSAGVRGGVGATWCREMGAVACNAAPRRAAKCRAAAPGPRRNAPRTQPSPAAACARRRTRGPAGPAWRFAHA